MKNTLVSHHSDAQYCANEHMTPTALPLPLLGPFITPYRLWSRTVFDLLWSLLQEKYPYVLVSSQPKSVPAFSELM